jgi:molybdopterin molybdotransferase
MVLPVARDDRAAIASVADWVSGADMLLTSGGASVGEHDLVQAALTERGLVVDFWKIAMRPGKPLMAGRLGSVPMIGLPGNPVSAMVCAILYVMPALARLSGLPGDPPPTVPARLGAPLRANDHRADFLRGRLTRSDTGELIATAFERQDSAMMKLLADADALILRAPHAPALEAGAAVQVIRLDMLGL